MTPYERLLLPENLYYAWKKAKRLYASSDGYVDRGELYEFELDLERRLDLIRAQFLKGKYKLQKIRPIPRPKKLKDGQYIDRQYYHISIDDQVAWIAAVNALGPELDREMPAWSYGNRLYRPAWYEEGEDRKSGLEIGPYRHSSGHLYKKFQHSWPLFRQHIALTARTMVRAVKIDSETEADQRAIQAAEREGLPYLENDFWQDHQVKGTTLYHASIDLEKFYPSISSSAILAGLSLAIDESVQGAQMTQLLSSMLAFRLDRTGLPATSLQNVEPAFDEDLVRGLPTGLFAAGFLANAALLPVDKKVQERIISDKSVAHFRFVDDHTIIAYDFDKLCEWIDWYKDLVLQKIGVSVNTEKYDPESLSAWLSIKASLTVRTDEEEKDAAVKRERAIEDTKIDGTNPTKLLTKTLEQVSAIAGTNANILDDNDLRDRLKLLEWLLLADIPEREIRPDTRAAFAAGQIASLAPIFIQQADGVVDKIRELESIRKAHKNVKSLDHSEIEELQKEIVALIANHNQTELKSIGHYFSLLMQAMKEHAAKARLFFRLHQYCLLTGHKGIGEIIAWIATLRAQKALSWADYYSNLTLQILAVNILKAIRILNNPASLRSDQIAARNHLEDIASVNLSGLKVPQEREAWFHAVGRREFAASLVIASEFLQKSEEFYALSNELRKLALSIDAPLFSEDSTVWAQKTGYNIGVWAHLAESILSVNEEPSLLWSKFEHCFLYDAIPDLRSARRYPEILSQRAWDYLTQSKGALRKDDSGWVYDVLKRNSKWLDGAQSSTNKAVDKAAHAFSDASDEFVSISDWTVFIRELSPFDPRRSEWTALEIIRKIVEPKLNVVGATTFNPAHPHNILIPASWKTPPSKFKINTNHGCLSWEEWRTWVREKNKIKFLGAGKSILDYRYSIYSEKELQDAGLIRERQLNAIGRLLLGLLLENHAAPRIWNIRGNERIIDLPRALMFQSLAISSPTLLLIEGCLDPRSAESRSIPRQRGLFGLEDDDVVNDMRYDPPPINGINDLVAAIDGAQEILEKNQLAVSMHQPRQLIPFRLSDFAVAASGEVGDASSDE